MRDSYTHVELTEDEVIDIDVINLKFRYFKANGKLVLKGTYTRCDFTGADLSECVIDAKFDDCDFTDVNFSETVFRSVKFLGKCIFLGTDFSYARGLFTTEMADTCKLQNFKGAYAYKDPEKKIYTLTGCFGADIEGKIREKPSQRVFALPAVGGSTIPSAPSSPTVGYGSGQRRPIGFQSAYYAGWEDYWDEYTPVAGTSEANRKAVLMTSNDGELDGT